MSRWLMLVVLLLVAPTSHSTSIKGVNSRGVRYGIATTSPNPLTADFTIEKPATCVDGACTIAVKALNPLTAHTTSTDGTLDLRKDILYLWNFGNPSAGTWTNGALPGQSKNTHCCGHWFAHFYEGGDTGTITVTLTAIDTKNNTTSTATHTLSVVSQTAQWCSTAGICATQTLCVNTQLDSNFTGCPTNAGHRNIGVDAGYSDWDDAVRTTMSTPNRVMFKCGSTYTANAPLNTSPTTGPKLITGYGSCSYSTDPNSTGDGGTVVVNDTVGQGTTGHPDFISGGGSPNINNLTFAYHTINGIGYDNDAGIAFVFIAGNVHDMNFYRMRVRNHDIAIYLLQGNAPVDRWNRVWRIETLIGDNRTLSTTHNGWGVAGGCGTCGGLGGFFDHRIGSHSERSGTGNYRVSAYETFETSTNSAGAKAVRKFNASHASDSCNNNGGDQCFSDNEYQGWDKLVSVTGDVPQGSWVFEPQEGGCGSEFGTEELKNGIVEGNYLDLSASTVSGTIFGMNVLAHDFVFRNNVCTLGNSTTTLRCIAIAGVDDGGQAVNPTSCLPTTLPVNRPAQMGERNDVLNTTMYSGSSSVPTILLAQSVTGARHQNNFLYGPSLGGTAMMDDRSNTGTNTTDHNVKQTGGTNPFTGAGTYNDMSDFSLTSTATNAIDAGVCLYPTASDAANNQRPNGVTCDVGAFERGASALPFP